MNEPTIEGDQHEEEPRPPIREDRGVGSGRIEAWLLRSAVDDYALMDAEPLREQ
jgi:hypothetical protein